MANDFLALYSNVTTDLNRADLTTAAKNAVQESIRKYEGHRFYFNELAMTLSVTATNLYPISAFVAPLSASVVDIIEVDTLELIVNPTRSYELTPVPFAEMVATDSGISAYQGLPQIYTIWNQSIRLYPIPNATYSVLLSGHVKFKELSGDTDTNPWTNDAKELIRCAAEKLLYARSIKDPNMALVMQQAEQEALAALQRRTEALVPTRIEGHL